MNISKKLLAKNINKNFQEIPEYKILKIVDLLFTEIKNQLQNNNNVTIRNFGTFKMVHRNERLIVHPTTRELIVMPNQDNIRFVESKNYRKISNRIGAVENDQSNKSVDY